MFKINNIINITYNIFYFTSSSYVYITYIILIFRDFSSIEFEELHNTYKDDEDLSSLLNVIDNFVSQNVQGTGFVKSKKGKSLKKGKTVVKNIKKGKSLKKGKTIVKRSKTTIFDMSQDNENVKSPIAGTSSNTIQMLTPLPGTSDEMQDNDDENAKSPIAGTSSNTIQTLTLLPGTSDDDSDVIDEDVNDNIVNDIPDHMIKHNSKDFKLEFYNTRNIGLKENLRISFDSGTVQERIYSLKFKNHLINKKIIDIVGEIEKAVKTVIDKLKEHFRDVDLIRITVLGPLFHIPHNLELQPLGEVTESQIIELLENILQSDEDIKLTEGFEIHVGIARNPLGGGRLSRGYLNFLGDKCDVHMNRSTVKIISKDKLCFARSIAVCLAKDDLNKKCEKNGKGSDEYKKALLYYNKITRRGRPTQEKAAKYLQSLAGFSLNKAISFTDIPKFEKVLKCRIIIFAPHLQNKVIYAGRDKDAKTVIYLVYVRAEESETLDHFHPIVKLASFHRCGFFCSQCLKPFSNKTTHFCEGYCNICLSDGCKIADDGVICLDCHRHTRSQTCMKRHKKKGLCSQKVKCLSCARIYNPSDKHVCGERECPICSKVVTGRHFCYMRAKKPNKISYKYMFADFEADPDDSEHVPNLVIAHWTCQSCIEVSYRTNPFCASCGTACSSCVEKIGKHPKGSDKRQVCMKKEGCGLRRIMCFGDDAADNFCKFLFTDEHERYNVVFHNGQAYDFYMLMKYICRHGMSPKIIYRGSKIVAAKICDRLNIRLIDSLNFLSMPLSAMPKVFNLQNIKKGTFPHWFNKKENYEYVGPLPHPDYYGVDNMKTDVRASFLEWYSKQECTTFNFIEELVAYCEDDVSILEESCLAFRKHVLDLTCKIELCDTGGNIDLNLIGVDPLSYNTMASVCMAIYRYMFLPEFHTLPLEDGRICVGELVNDKWVNITDSDGKNIDITTVQICESQSKFLSTPLARMPSGGFSNYDTYSKISIQWLLYVEKVEDISIQHALTSEGEYRVPFKNSYYRLDGYCHTTNTVYEFYGCVHHGCPECFPYNSSVLFSSCEELYPLHPHTRQTMKELYHTTIQRQEHIVEYMNCNIVVMWECSFRKQIECDLLLKQFIMTTPVLDRLKPRNALFGGRTNASRLFYDVSNTDEEIAYADITSLYPTVLKYDIFPAGIPEIIIKPGHTDISNFFGIIFCKVRPPRRLYHPVLPMRTDCGKLLFALCYSCAINNTDSCNCSVNERDMTGTWTNIELELAVKFGYVVLEIHEVYHFPSTTTNLFAGYVNMFVKHKQEASGWPREGMTNEEKEEYIKQYYNAEGITLNKENIHYNLGSRKISKQIANSLWGKFGEFQDRLQHVLVNDSVSFYSYLTNPFLEIKDFHVLSPNTCQIEYKEKHACKSECPYLNEFVAIFTTSHARIRLYKELNRINRNVLYYDTDSIIYTFSNIDENAIHPPYGDYLGMWTSELSSSTCIVQFVSAGPKSYAYETSSGSFVVKVKGLTLTYAASSLVNFDSIKALVLHYADPVLFPLPDEFNEKDSILVTYPSKIHRDRFKFKLYGRDVTKQFKVTYSKRSFLRDGTYDTVPFGY